MGRVCAYVPGQPGSYGRGRCERDSERWGFWGAGQAPGTQTEENQTLALTELRHTQGVISVSELEEEGERQEVEGEIEANKHLEKV